jgi:hypothetical protein
VLILKEKEINKRKKLNLKSLNMLPVTSFNRLLETWHGVAVVFPSCINIERLRVRFNSFLSLAVSTFLGCDT